MLAGLRILNDNLEATKQAILMKCLDSVPSTTVPLAELVDFIDGDRGSNYPTFDEFLSKGCCLFLNASNVTVNGFNFDSCQFITEEKDKLLNKGHLSLFDIILTSRGTLGNVALYDEHVPFENMRINSGMLIIRPKGGRLSPYLLYALLQSKYMKDAIEQFRSGSAQPQLPIKDLQKVTFSMPASDDIIHKLDEELRKIEDQISINRAEIDKLKGTSDILLTTLSR